MQVRGILLFIVWLASMPCTYGFAWGITTAHTSYQGKLSPFGGGSSLKTFKEVLIGGHIISKAQDRILPTRLMNHIHCPGGRGPAGVSRAIRNCPRIFFGVKPLDMSIGAQPQITLVVPGVQTR
jgi:hypothetical protein